MNDFAFATPAPPSVQVSAAMEPVQNILLSLWALTANDSVIHSEAEAANQAEEDVATDPVAVAPWILENAARLTPEQRRFNRLLFEVFGALLLPQEPYADFASYLDTLAGQPDALMQSRLISAAQSAPASNFRAEAEILLADPPALGQRIVEHLRSLWVGLLAAEWNRHIFMLAGMTNSINELIFSQARWQATNPFDALRFLLQTEPNDQQLLQLAGVRRIVLVWSPHLLTYCNRFGSSDTLWVVRTFDPQLMRRDPLSRAEVLRPLTALADDTRLRILERLTENGELRAQEIIAQLDSSQGNISRHLKQLVGAGLVREQHAGDANKHYQVDMAGLQRLQFLIRQLLSSHNVASVSRQQQLQTQLEKVRSNASPALHDLLDEQGRITRWSNKQKDQQEMMAYLAEKFEVERAFSEKQVNELLQQWYLDADYVLVRRSLIDAGLLHRTKDGARYWR